MSLSILRLCLFASFLAMVLGSSFRPIGKRDATVSKRQVTRNTIVNRAATRALLRDISARQPMRARQAETSPVPYPNCAAGLNLAPGYAHYPGWDSPGREEDRPQPVDISEPGAFNERQCQELCNDSRGELDEANCIGVFWLPNYVKPADGKSPCWLKDTTYPWSPSDYSNTNAAAVQPGSATDFRGTCAYWKQFVPAAMDAVCCQT